MPPSQPSDRSQPPIPSSLLDRIVRIEEVIGFADHTSTQITTEVLALSKRLDHVLRRLEALERRLEEAAQSSDGTATSPVPHTDDELRRQKPPHSA